jgi:hypothetical protein
MSHAMMTSQVFVCDDDEEEEEEVDSDDMEYTEDAYANLLNGPTIYRKLGNANIARTYIDTRYRMFHPITKTSPNYMSRAMMTSQVFVIRVL